MKRWICLLLLTFYQPLLLAKPHVTTEFGRSLDGYIRIKVINQTSEELACYVMVDGWKMKFRLPPNVHSRWYKATDKRFTVESFSTWCDYIALHPEYKRYIVR